MIREYVRRNGSSALDAYLDNTADRDLSYFSFGSVKDKMKSLYNGLGNVAEGIRRRPYIGLGGLGAILGGLAGVIAGPIGVLGAGIIGGSVGGGLGAGYHWLWGREGEDVNFPPVIGKSLKGMSIGKRIREYCRTGN